MGIQQQIFESIKAKHSSNLSLIDEISELLKIGKSSVYDRINGKKPLTLPELTILSQHFGLSVDKYLSDNNASVAFQFNSLLRHPSNFDEYLDYLIADLTSIIQIPTVKVYYATNEIPLFYYFLFPELALFKLYIWGKSNWEIPGRVSDKFDFKSFPDKERLIKKSLLLGQTFQQASSVEFWTVNIFDNTLNQILYSAESKKFTDVNMPQILLSVLRRLLDKMELMAEKGRKTPEKPRGNLQLFHNKITHTNNVVLVEIGGIPRKIYFAFDNPNIMTTDNIEMCRYTRNWYEKLKTGSTALSQSDEPMRVYFFESIRNRINETERLLKKL